MKTSITLLLLICALIAKGAVFTVTSNADNGPGTLRDAILQANANVLSAPNVIVFNIADQSQAGRTIKLLSTLPQLSSSLSIDGSTQPGSAFGITNARIILTNDYNWQYGYYFDMLGVTNVGIYGLWLQGVGAGAAFHFRECKSMQFGTPGKGNIINGFGIAFYCDYNLGTEPGSRNIYIQNNIMGTDPTGTFTDYTTINGIDFYFVNVANLQIGGMNPNEGNLMVEGSYPMNYTCTRNEDFGYLNIEGNLQGTDITGTRRLCANHFGFEINGYNDGQGDVTYGTTALAVRIVNNVSVSGYDFYKIASPFTIQGNHIGVGADNITDLITGTNGGTSSLLYLINCTGGLIGGPNPGDKNYLAYNGTGVFEFWCGNITISRNSFFCNSAGISMNWFVPRRPAPFIGINLLTTSMVGGTALPNSLIELFYDDECPGCEGKTFIGTTTADNNGNWSYSIVATGAIVATATDTFGATSPFSKATINTDSLVVKNATCGLKNGSIKNIQVTSGTEWYWKDALGNIVANSTDLTNVGPGTYTFVTSIGGEACDASSTPYIISNINLPAFDPTSISITQPGCGQNNGALKYAGSFNTAALYSWQLSGITVLSDFSTVNPFKNLAPGNYTLQLSLKTDSTCMAKYGPFTLANQSGPTLSTAAVTITPSTCGGGNGTLTGIGYQNAVQPVYIAWQDTLGRTVGSNINLSDAAAGKYRLLFKDAGGCDTIFTSWYTIPDEGTITIDSSRMMVKTASCESSNGAITGIQSSNADSYTWKSITNNGAVAGNTEDLTQVSGGIYQLTMTNSYGCQAQTAPVTIAQMPKPQIDYSNLKYVNDTCNAGLAAIGGLVATDKQQNYTWAWYKLDANNGNQPGPVIDSTAGYLGNIRSGTYLLQLTDQSGCSVTSRDFTINDIELNPPPPQVSDQYIPRNTSAVIRVSNLQTGVYKLLGSDNPNAGIIDSSLAGILTTPGVAQDETLYVLFTRGDCSSSVVPVNIKVFDSVRIYVPNAFSPNNDGINDRWHIVVQGLIQKIHIAVFDRWGVQVFATNDPAVAWDGRFHGQLISGGFVYTVEGTDFYSRPFKLRGTIMIVR